MNRRSFLTGMAAALALMFVPLKVFPEPELLAEPDLGGTVSWNPHNDAQLTRETFEEMRDQIMNEGLRAPEGILFSGSQKDWEEFVQACNDIPEDYLTSMPKPELAKLFLAAGIEDI